MNSYITSFYEYFENITIPGEVWGVIALFVVPLAIVFSAILLKLLWGFWPVPVTMIPAVSAIYQYGIELFWLVALALIVGVLFTKSWQGTGLFMKVDLLLEKIMFIRD